MKTRKEEPLAIAQERHADLRAYIESVWEIALQMDAIMKGMDALIDVQDGDDRVALRQLILMAKARSFSIRESLSPLNLPRA